MKLLKVSPIFTIYQIDETIKQLILESAFHQTLKVLAPVPQQQA
jgi:hypothetical protein